MSHHDPHGSDTLTTRGAPLHHPEAEQSRSWTVLIIALIAQVLVVLDISIVNTALPSIGQSLHLDSGDLQWLVTAYLLMSGGGLLLGGRVADLFSRRRVFMTGLGLFTTASFVAGFASSAAVLIAARATQGLGAALMTPAALSLIMTTYTGAQRARGLALWGAVGSMSVAGGVLLGGILTTWAGWQTIFWVNVPVGAAAFTAALVVLPRQATERADRSQLDLPGGVVLVTGLATLLLGVQRASQDGWASPTTLALFAAAAAALAGFIAIERRVDSPLVPPHTWKVKTLVAGTSVMLGTTGILVATIFLTSIFVQTVLGYTALQTGLAFLPLALAMAAAAHSASHLAAMVAARWIAGAGLALTVIGALLLSRAPATSHYIADLLPGLLLLGFGIGLVFVSVSMTAMNGIPPQHAGMASGFLMTGHEVGAALGVAIISAVATTAGSLASAAGAADAFGRGMVGAGVLAVAVAVVAVTKMPATRQQAGAVMHMHH
jgi:EmrB/QacA subfamily drug resistance transporter